MAITKRIKSSHPRGELLFPLGCAALVILGGCISGSASAERSSSFGGAAPSSASSEVVAPGLWAGMTKDQVIAALGTPSSRSDQVGTWYYDNSSIQFEEDHLVAVDNRGNLPVVSIPPQGTDLRAGMTKTEVLAILGMPTWRSSLGTRWQYGSSTIQFKDDRLVSVDDSGDLYAEPIDATIAPEDSPAQAENGDIKGADNDGDGRIETIFVPGYFRKDGSYVQGHYRAQPSGSGSSAKVGVPILGAGRRSTAAPTSSSGPVHVRGYYRRDGTYVRPHTRSRSRR